MIKDQDQSMVYRKSLPTIGSYIPSIEPLPESGYNQHLHPIHLFTIIGAAGQST